MKRAAFEGATVLGSAGRARVVAVLLAAGAAVNKANKAGSTPLFVSAQGGHTEVITALLAAGAAVDKALFRDGFTPLLVSVQEGNTLLGHFSAADGGGGGEPGRPPRPEPTVYGGFYRPCTRRRSAACGWSRQGGQDAERHATRGRAEVGP